jgi:hypothetical protein
VTAAAAGRRGTLRLWETSSLRSTPRSSSSRRATGREPLPEGGTPSLRQVRELLERLGDFYSQRLDRSPLFVDLPIAEPDPLLRYRKTVAASRELKGAGQSRGAESLIELAGAAPPLIHGAVASST